MHFTYFYRIGDKPIYIGLARKTLMQRINAHAHEKKFQPYLQDCEILVHEWKTKSDAELMEKLLIKAYKPVLNVVDMTTDSAFQLSTEVEWIPLEQYLVNHPATPSVKSEAMPLEQMKWRHKTRDIHLIWSNNDIVNVNGISPLNQKYLDNEMCQICMELVKKGSVVLESASLQKRLMPILNSNNIEMHYLSDNHNKRYETHPISIIPIPPYNEYNCKVIIKSKLPNKCMAWHGITDFYMERIVGNWLCNEMMTICTNYLNSHKEVTT